MEFGEEIRQACVCVTPSDVCFARSRKPNYWHIKSRPLNCCSQFLQNEILQTWPNIKNVQGETVKNCTYLQINALQV